MSHSGRQRHRDTSPGHRHFDDTDIDLGGAQRFVMTRDQRERIARSLRLIDDARLALQAQHNADNREIIRELRASADAIFDVLSSVEPVDETR